jgi:putative selenate reductase molybdopterin-binding subunit
MKINLTLNGHPTEFEVAPHDSLLDTLRSANFISVKRGCQTGECGSCSVLIDGKLTPSCVTLAAQVDGHAVMTLEGLSAGGELHPLQKAFMETGAIQCGYCTPGMLLGAKALLDKEKYPDLQQTRDTLAAVLCRCTGYTKPVEAVLRAAAYLRGESVPPIDDQPPAKEEAYSFFGDKVPKAEPPIPGFTRKVVGAPSPKVDAFKLAKGRPAFTDDVKLPGMLYAALLTSPHAHARIKNIDTNRAKALPGVVEVLTFKDVPRNHYASGCQSYPNPRPYDQVSLDNKVRHVGDRVAVVAAETLEIAKKALDLIEVEYELLPAVFTAQDALKDGAPVIHDESDTPGIKDAAHNLVTTLSANLGSVEEGLAKSDHVFERTYKVQQVQQAHLEPNVCITYWDEDQRLVVRSGTQAAFHMRRVLASILDLPVNRIRVIKPRVGGAFGAKMDIMVQDLAAHLTIRTGRPVRLEYTREQEFTSARSRHPATVTYKVGVSKDGILQAIDMTVLENTGAYGVQGMTVCNLIGARGLSTYRCDNVRFSAKIVYTNTPVPAAFRGFGGPQGQFSMESMMDEIAQEMKWDLIEFQKKNVVKVGDTIQIVAQLGEGGPVPQVIRSCNAVDCMDKAAAAIGWERRLDPKWKIDPARPHIRCGLGMALIMHGTSIPALQMGGAFIKINDDGSFNLMVGADDLGTGSDTAVAQIAAETLGVPLTKIHILSADTDVTPFETGAYASSTTFVTGNAIKKAAEIVRQKMFERAARMLETGTEGMTAHDNHVFTPDGRYVSLPEIAMNSLHLLDQEQIMATASYSSNDAPPAFGAQFAEVEVDIETGQVTPIKLVLAVDPGTVINPLNAEGQMEGGMATALGYALCEEMVYDEKGNSLARRFNDYHIFQADELPEMVSILVPSFESSGPYGAKGMGEITVEGAAPAIANAVFNAVGVRMRELPILPEKVWKALQEK